MNYPPRKHWIADKCRQRGLPVVVSLVGDTHLPWPHVYADPGRAHDWGCLRGLHVVVATKPKLDAGHAIAGAFNLWDESMSSCAPYPTLVDIERRHVMHVCGIRPLHVMRPRAGSECWNEYFAAA